jgi:predicted ATP-grasp superfamily ATP-dependent carboligase
MTPQIPVLLTPLDEHMGLDIARSLGKRGIPIYALDSDPDAVGKYSKYVHFYTCPDPEENGGIPYINFVVDFVKKLDRKVVLFPLSDEHVLLFSRERELIKNYCFYMMPDHETISNLVTKDGLDKIVRKFNIPAPRTFFLDGIWSIESIAERLDYPVILKPTESTYWHTPEITTLLRKGLIACRAKIIECQTAQELIDSYNKISSIDNRLVVQEIIPGEDSRLVYISFYLDQNSTPLGMFAGRKYRVLPTGFGSASYARSMYDPELEKLALTVLRAVNYRGLGGIEFKLDSRDNQYKIIEFNARFGMWDGLGAKCGVDLAYLAYCDAIGIPVGPVKSYKENFIWVDWQRDIRAVIDYIKKGQLTFGEWLKSLRGKKMWAIYSMDDWRPGAAFTYRLVGKLIDRCFGTIKKNKNSAAEGYCAKTH